MIVCCTIIVISKFQYCSSHIRHGIPVFEIEHSTFTKNVKHTHNGINRFIIPGIVVVMIKQSEVSLARISMLIAINPLLLL